MSSQPILPLGPELPDKLLEARGKLPSKPDAVELVGPRLQLRPYEESDGNELHAISNGNEVERLGTRVADYDADELVWRYLFAGPFETATELVAFHNWVDSMPDARVFTVVDQSTGQLLGSTSYVANQPAHLKVEIGNVWYTPAVQGSGVNAEATMLLVRHAAAIGYQRIEWKCHVDNLRSRRAALALGFKFEGVQEAHYIVKNRRRDTAWFRILSEELDR